jgi:predicted naringenin-chalcone synthase
LGEADLAESWAVLNDHGNCSSATVLLVLERLRRERDLLDGDPVLFMSFGPGLTLYAALLRVRSGEPG